MKGVILIVDDDAAIRNGIGRTLGSEGHDLHFAADANQAIETVKTTAIDVMVTDERMPGPWGTELLSRVREISPGTMRVLLTGSPAVDTLMAAVNEGEIFRFLTKPCPPDLLRDTVRQALLHYRFRAESEALLATASTQRAILDRLSADYPELVREAEQAVRAAPSQRRAQRGPVDVDLGPIVDEMVLANQAVNDPA